LVRVHIKGTIDLITTVPTGYEIIDYKSGQLAKIEKHKTKSIADLHEDFQIKIISLCRHQLYPEIADIGYYNLLY